MSRLVVLCVVAMCLCSDVFASPIAAPCSNYKDTGITVDDATIVVSDCTAPPCIFKKGTNASISFSFKANTNLAAEDVKIYGQILKIWTQLPGGLTDPNLCHMMTPQCTSIKAGQEYKAHFELGISSSYPSIQLLCEMRIVDHDSGNVEGCSEFQAKISS